MFGFAIAVVALSYGYFHHMQPNLAQAAVEQTYGEQLQQQASRLPAAKQRVALAQKMVEDVAAQWRAIVATKTPPATLREGGIDLAVNPYQMVMDARVYRNNLQRAVNKQLKRGGVLVLNGPQIPFPPDDPNTVLSGFFNYPALQYPVVVFDLGAITVQGTYNQIVQNMIAWRDMPNYLAVASGLTLNGTSPILTGTYTVSMVGFLRGKTLYPTPPPGSAVVGIGTAPPAQQAPATPPPGGGRNNAPGGRRIVNPPAGSPGR